MARLLISARAGVTARSRHLTETAVQAAEINRSALGQQRVHEGDVTGDARSAGPSFHKLGESTCARS